MTDAATRAKAWSAVTGPWLAALLFLALALLPAGFSRETTFLMLLQVFLIEPVLGFAGLAASGAWRASPPYGGKRWAAVIGIGGLFAFGLGWLVYAGLASPAALFVFAPLLLRVADWCVHLGAPRGHGMVMQWSAVASFVGPLLIGLVCLAFYERAPTDPPGTSSVPPATWAVALAVAAYYVGFGVLARYLANRPAAQLEREAADVHDGDGHRRRR